MDDVPESTRKEDAGSHFRRLITDSDSGSESRFDEEIDQNPSSDIPEGQSFLEESSVSDDTKPIKVTQNSRIQPNRVHTEPKESRMEPGNQPGSTKPVKIQKRQLNELKQVPGITKKDRQEASSGKGSATKKVKNSKKNLNKPWNIMGCFLRLVIFSLFIFVITGICGISFLFYEYYRIASTLPEIDDLRGRASKFETTRILDRNGNLLYEIIDPMAGRRTFIPIEKISPYLIAATIATEDKGFYTHPGVDFFAIARAFWQNYQGRSTVSGASTITQQLARNLLFSPEERYEQTYQRKIREAVLATEITRRYSKDEILELYLNELNYGFLSYGIEAAAETYFNTTADKLTLAQASFLAGLPQAPAIYDIYTNPEQTLKRHEDVLVLMYQASKEQGCIYVSNYPERICVDAVSVTQAVNEIKNYQFNLTAIKMRYPHWVTYVKAQLEAMFDPQTIYRSGFSVYTTLDPGLQDFAQTAIQNHIQALQGKNVTNGALVIIRPTTREILAMVGSADFYNESISGQVNMAISPRQPGSAIKPLTYLASFEKGWTPSTLIWDVPTEFSPSGNPEDPSEPYVPRNYTGKFYGPVTLRTALANSLNIPAVKALEFVGIYDDLKTPEPDGFINFARRVGITTLTRDDYGLSLTLGGGEVTLLELTNFYATLANNGVYLPPVSIKKIVDRNGNIIYDYLPPIGEAVLRPEHVYLMSSILSDNEARGLVMGTNSNLNLPFQVAAKTGTTNNVRDNWTLGYTPDVAVGVWVGNADYTPMIDTDGMTGAAPIWSKMIQEAIQRLTGNQPSPFIRPPGIVEYSICEASGTFPSELCKKQKIEIFASDQPPLSKEFDLVQKVSIDTWTGLLASSECSEFIVEKIVLNVQDQAAKKWIKKDNKGINWAREMGFDDAIEFIPPRACTANDPRPKLGFLIPSPDETITTSPLGIYVVAAATENFDWVRLDYGLGQNPKKWKALEEKRNQFKEPSLFFEWDLMDIPTGIITLRLYMQSTNGTYAETRLHINIEVPTPTPTPTHTPVPTSTPTPTPTETPTLSPTPIPSSTIEPTIEPEITLPPAVTPTTTLIP